MKPKINDIIYIIYRNSISREKVYMLGENEFIHGNAFNEVYNSNYRSPLKYDEYNTCWFKTLKEAKAYLGGKVKKIDDGYWEPEN